MSELDEHLMFHWRDGACASFGQAVVFVKHVLSEELAESSLDTAGSAEHSCFLFDAQAKVSLPAGKFYTHLFC